MLDVLKDVFRRWYFSRRYRDQADALCYLEYSYDDCLKVESIARRLNLGPEWHPYIEEVIDEWCWKNRA